MENKFARPPIGGAYDALVGRLGPKIFFVCVVGSLEHRDVGVVGGNRVEHAVKGGCVQSLVGIVAEYDSRHTAGVCSDEADIKAGVY